MFDIVFTLFTPVHSAEYPYGVGMRFKRTLPPNEYNDYCERINQWCKQNLEPNSWSLDIYYGELHFKTESDLVLFKLRWL